ncbi:MAG: aspartate kinase [Bacteroidetes bacterium]|nr:aspartate kinase [Bacteroidota bacterium]
MKVLKFGGTSVGSAARMKDVAKLVVNDEPKIVVLSAMSGTTNTLVEIGNLLSKNKQTEAVAKIEEMEAKYNLVMEELYKSAEIKAKAVASIKENFSFMKTFVVKAFNIYQERALLAQGELMSTAMFQFLLEEQGVSSVLLPALNFMKITKDEEPDLAYIKEHIAKELKKYAGVDLFVTQGFICRNTFGEIDNLKRGGSDYTASIVGYAINSSEIQIWTDIDGMHNNDPRMVGETRPVAQLSFDEAAELAYFGAKILHPQSILPAKLANIPVKLLNTMDPTAKGTTITEESGKGDAIKAVAAKDGITAIKIKSARMLLAYGFLRSVFEVFERYRTPIDMITTSEVAVSLTIDDNAHLTEIVKELEAFGTVEVDKDQTIICLVGDMISEEGEMAMKLFTALKEVPLRMISYGGSRHNISVLTNAENKVKALQKINEGLFGLKGAKAAQKV